VVKDRKKRKDKNSTQSSKGQSEKESNPFAGCVETYQMNCRGDASIAQ
jgi:hypothetical protein